MALTPEQIAQLRGEAGLSPTPPSSGAGDILAMRRKALGLADVTLPPEKPSFFSRAKKTIQESGNQLQEQIQGQGEYAGQSDIRRGTEAAATLATAPLKVAMDAAPEPVRHAAEKVGEAASGVVNWLGDKIGSTQVAQDFVMKHPEAAKYLEEAAGTAAAGGEIAGAILGPKGGSKAVETAVSKGAPIAETAAMRAKIAAEDVAAKVDEKITKKVYGTPLEQAMKEREGILKVIGEDEETMTTGMKADATEQGRRSLTKGKLGDTVKITQTPELERAAQILQEGKTVTAKDTPDVARKKIDNVISVRGAEAEKYLDDNIQKISNKEHADLVAQLKAEAEKTLTDTELKAYDEQFKLFSKQLVGRGGMTTGNYYRALKDWEQNIASKLPRGNEGLLDPTGIANAKIRAAADIRKAVRDMIDKKNPDFAARMYDLMSLYEARNQALYNAKKFKSKTVFQKYPRATKAAAAVPIAGATIGIVK